LEEILKRFASGNLSIEEAARELKLDGIGRLGEFAKIDLNRQYRTGIPEIVFAEGKRSADVADIALAHATAKGFALISRASHEDAAELKAKNSIVEEDLEVDFNEVANTILVKKKGYEFTKRGKIGVIAAGTADIPGAEEARGVAEVCGCEVLTVYDVGIAGIHRLVKPLEEFVTADVAAVVVVAGMEGALPSVVASLVDMPVIGVPTSVGYGIGGKGIAALLAMLQSCSPGLAVVNIDNGVGAGTFAAKCVMHKKSNSQI